jgi:hypothetical protein
VDIIDQDLRPKTMVFLGRKKDGDDLEMVLEEEDNALANEKNHNLLMKENNELEKNNVKLD